MKMNCYRDPVALAPTGLHLLTPGENNGKQSKRDHIGYIDLRASTNIK